MAAPDSTLTDEELAAIESRCEAATRGPWKWRGDYPTGTPCQHGTDWADHGPDLVSETDTVPGKVLPPCSYVTTVSGYDASRLNIEDADAEFIAHARTDVPRLIAALRASRGEAERLYSSASPLTDRILAEQEVAAEMATERDHG